MRILVVHPVMDYLGGGESLCCETIRVLHKCGHEISVLSGNFDPKKVETRFGFPGLFGEVRLLLYPPLERPGMQLGLPSHLIHHLRSQRRMLDSNKGRGFDLIFSTQDESYVPEPRGVTPPIVQWGYFPKNFPPIYPFSIRRTVRTLPLRIHSEWNVSRIGLVLAISEYSKLHFDNKWKRPSALVYPPCEMVEPRQKRNVVVTAARASPEKRLELFWELAKDRPGYEFLMLLTMNPALPEYSRRLADGAPSNGHAIINASKELYQKTMGEAKVYIHLMEEERFGITIIEAMSAGCVPIVHESGAPLEFVDEEVGFRWRTRQDLLGMIDSAMQKSSSPARSKAQNFNRQQFDRRLSSVFSALQVQNPSLSR